MTLFITKADGNIQPFDREKIIRTCLKMHASREDAEEIADKIEKRLYNGIQSKKVLQMIFVFMKDYSSIVRHQVDVRLAVSLMRPKPDFEHFIGLILSEMGYEVLERQSAGSDLMIQGKCIEHEVDAVAKKPGEVVFIEVKHHYDMHSFTPLAVCLEVRSTFEDLQDGFKLGKNRLDFTAAMVVCNTKFSEHAIKYAHCRGIGHLGWGGSDGHPSLGQLIDKYRLDPITVIKRLDRTTQGRLGDKGVVTLRQLAGADIADLAKATRVQKGTLESISRLASEILAAKP